MLFAWKYSLTHTKFHAYHQSSKGLTSKGPAIQKSSKMTFYRNR